MLNRLVAALLITTAPALATAQDAPRNSSVEVGTLNLGLGEWARVGVSTSSGRKSPVLYVSDRHGIKNYYLAMTPGQARQLRDLLDKAIAEAEQ